jgi:3-hydroxyisobutyrate dehydrogenase-like beta-hydroxyacid dehydrogenase
MQMSERNDGELPAGSPSHVGLIGLGLMGGAMATRLRGGGHTVLGFDTAAQTMQAAVCAGVIAASGAGEIARRCRRVLLSLPDSAAVETVVETMAGSPRPGQIIVDTTTGDPNVCARLGARLSALGIEYLDATVSGNSDQVRSGATMIMAGGTAAGFAACEDLLRLFASRVMHAGPCGNGARLKLITNLVLGLNRVALAEGLVFARALGVEPAQALDVLRASMAGSRIMDSKGPKMVRGDFTPQARLAQHLKDVRLMLAQADGAGLPMPLSRAHARLLESAVAAGLGDLDNAAIIQMLGPSLLAQAQAH